MNKGPKELNFPDFRTCMNNLIELKTPDKLTWDLSINKVNPAILGGYDNYLPYKTGNKPWDPKHLTRKEHNIVLFYDYDELNFEQIKQVRQYINEVPFYKLINTEVFTKRDYHTSKLIVNLRYNLLTKIECFVNNYKMGKYHYKIGIIMNKPKSKQFEKMMTFLQNRIKPIKTKLKNEYADYVLDSTFDELWETHAFDDENVHIIELQAFEMIISRCKYLLEYMKY